MHDRTTLPTVWIFGLLAGAMLFSVVLARAAELAPAEILRPLGAAGPELGRYAPRTLVVGLEVDRDGVRLIAYTAKERPYLQPLDTAVPRAAQEGGPAQLEIVLAGPGGATHTRRVEVDGLCLVHAAGEAPHVAGDTFALHRDGVIVELPDLAGFDTVEVARHGAERGALARVSLGSVRLDPGSALTTGAVIWPEEIGDPDLYHVYGDESQNGQRINIVIVPDGYTPAQKALLESHAAATVAHFRNKTPYREHDPFIAYTLVYAYSTASGTDQCDCATLVDTAMGTGFPAVTPGCGHSDNRCLNYGNLCDTSGTANIVAAELRAPYRDKTILMVNTTRYGGCGGPRSTFAAGNASAAEIAVHELGHSLAALADEYGGNPSCGAAAGGINTSLDPLVGAWPEWIADLGAPRTGGQYYNSCIHRPLANCAMRSLGQAFCPVCNQRWSLVTFGHSRVAPTAPIASMDPGAAATAWTGIPAEFSVGTRFSSGPGITNSLTWRLAGPGFPSPTVVATGTSSHSQSFPEAGSYELTCEVVADTNFVKPERTGANRDVATWSVEVADLAPPGEVSPPGSIAPLRFATVDQIDWEPAAASGAFTFNLYRDELAALGAGGYGSCQASGLATNGSTATGEPAPGSGWFYLVSGANPAGEGPLGHASSGASRLPELPCAP